MFPPSRQGEVRDHWRTNGETPQTPTSSIASPNAWPKPTTASPTWSRSAHSQPSPAKELPEFAWLADSETPLLIRNNMRVYLARWLVQQGYYDEAIAWTDGLETDDVVAPEALLFYRAIAHHQLVQPTRPTAAIAQLLQRQEKLPTRYQKLADLMHHDLKGLKDDSLDHISRRMDDIRRRLAQGRSGERAADGRKRRHRIARQADQEGGGPGSEASPAGRRRFGEIAAQHADAG